jgi:hypothetical protein
MITLRPYVIDHDLDSRERIEYVLVKDNLNMICPDKIRPCSSRCPFCHIEEKKVTLTCRPNAEHFILS